MANKRTLKKGINAICEALFAECMAVSLYGSKEKRRMAEDQAFGIMKLQDHYIRRISHPEPGISAKAYYTDLCEKFRQQCTEILDSINS